MKRLSNLLAALVFASLVIFMSCGGGGDDPAPDPLIAKAENLTVAWSPTAVNDPDGVNQLSTWSNFTLTFSGNESGGTYSTGSTTPTGFEDVWPASGSWVFADTDGEVITRDGSLTINVTALSATQLTLEFDFQSSARTSSIDGEWTFSFSPN
ncbi:hypothetical protein [Ekhidna sp.]|uniref:hypothetical protein n=1 Tax=Ekhidna sp. TaxID=2608089 RepID=UPI003299BF83